MKHPCEICKGACCEEVILNVADKSPESREYLQTRLPMLYGAVVVEIQCPELAQGRCTIYEDRPQVCRDYKVGGFHCIDVIGRRRPEQSDEIYRAIAQMEVNDGEHVGS